ncbi:glycerophosphodiester phosphodiesterase family protein [Chachezhania sediminis]|uniref:glycerophosphodiester phosphodiesterase family protein n=1 Tax=Chachezhania sediminis TaxID=2599291 RepID=UPI00131C1A4C|nr:glycerophosphodiester phosphodiesterase family protein [Chachezhania sediminis]
MRPPLPDAFLRLPIAHRALHDLSAGRPENSLPAIQAAVDAGYGIEIDLQVTSDGHALVFHDYALERLTGRAGLLRDLTAAEASATPLTGGGGACIPRFSSVLSAVAGRVPLLVEIKDQDRDGAPGTGVLERAAAEALAGYAGPVAVMSFNPASVAAMADLAPAVPRGLVTMFYDAGVGNLPAETCDHLNRIADFDRVGASFISHHWTDLSRPRVRKLWGDGVPVLCWTIRSPEEEAEARARADNVTFEGYLPPLGA